MRSAHSRRGLLADLAVPIHEDDRTHGIGMQDFSLPINAQDRVWVLLQAIGDIGQPGFTTGNLEFCENLRKVFNKGIDQLGKYQVVLGICSITDRCDCGYH